MPEKKFADGRRFEKFIGTLLRIGVMLSGAVAVLGGAVLFLGHSVALPRLERFAGEPHGLTSIPGILGSAFSLDGRGLIQFGLLVLIAVPLFRVAFSVVAFTLRRDWLYCAVTAAVLALLVGSLLWGR
ncbi:MAG TPA: DUF1634 domain-containing protein [Chitinivibrionales bacterium]|nr:DUF1634 domain-containing protein [Chitinivibrionales bacterium]